MKNIFLFFSCCILFSVSSCKNTKDEKIHYEDLRSLTLGIIPSTEYFPYFIAYKQGYYADMGLSDFQLVKFSTETELYAAFLSGEIDGMLTDYIRAIIQYSRGTKLSFVMNTESNYHLIAAKNSRTTSIEDLKGKNIAITPNTVSAYITDRIINEHSTLQLNDINKPEIITPATRMEMLQYGQIDASVFPDLYATYVKRKGNATSIATTQQLKIPVAGAAFSMMALTEKRREIEVLIRGYNRAVKFMNSHPQREWIQLLIDQGDISETLSDDILLPVYKRASLPERTHIESSVRWLRENNHIPDEIYYEQLIDTIEGIRFN